MVVAGDGRLLELLTVFSRKAVASSDDSIFDDSWITNRNLPFKLGQHKLTHKLCSAWNYKGDEGSEIKFRHCDHQKIEVPVSLIMVAVISKKVSSIFRIMGMTN